MQRVVIILLDPAGDALLGLIEGPYSLSHTSSFF
jgi:hypothetical protein